MYKKYLKRFLDFVAAFCGLVLLSPIFIIVMVGLFFANKGKPFFVQERPGLNEKIFKIIKFNNHELIKRVKEGGKPLVSFDEIINTTKASFAAIESLKTGRWVNVD